MFNFTGQAKALILVVNDFEVELYVWEKKTLHFHTSFDNILDQTVLFEQILNSFKKFPAIVIADFIEESFRHETAVHVSGGDRTAILNRKLDYSFRNTPYRFAYITGREDEGRRDDKVLLSGLSKPELLSPWIDTLLDKKIAIQSISSASYLLNSFVSSKGKALADEEHLLIVSLEQGSYLRQSYLKKGKLLFSRLTTLNTRNSSSLGNNILQESLQLRQYLERIQFLPYEDRLKIHIYCPHGNDELSIEEKSSNVNEISLFNTLYEANQYRLDLKDNVPGPTSIFLAQVLKKKNVPNVYASSAMRKYFHLNTLSLALSFSAAAFILATFIFKTPTLLESIDKQNQEQQLIAQTSPLLTEYNVLSQRFPETPIPSKEMALVVETSEAITSQAFTPLDAMEMLSTALLSSPDLQVTNLLWEVVEAEEVEESQESQFASFGSFAPPAGGGFISVVLEQRTMLKLEIQGIAFSPNSFREAQDQVLTLVNTLETMPGVSVESEKMPTDVRSDIQVNTVVGDEELRSTFILQLTIDTTERE